MIIDNYVNYNEYCEKILNFYGFWDYTSPCCGAHKSLIRHGSYSRNIIVIKAGVFHEENITVLRLLCKSCNSTHAILPAGTIPYSLYSFESIFLILLQYFIKNESAPKISEATKVPCHMIYLFLNKYLLELFSVVSFLNIYLEAINLSFNTSPSIVFKLIHQNFKPIKFFHKYYIDTGQIFSLTRCVFNLSNIMHTKG